MSLERSVTEAQAKEYLESYSIGLGPTERWHVFHPVTSVALVLQQGGDGDQAGGQDEGGPEEGSPHQLEEDRQDNHQILEVCQGLTLILDIKYVLICQKARHKRR